MQYTVLLSFLKRAKRCGSMLNLRKREPEIYAHLNELGYKAIASDMCEHPNCYIKSHLLSKMKTYGSSKAIREKYPHQYLYGVLAGYLPVAEDDLQYYDSDDVLSFETNSIVKLARRYANMEAFKSMYPKHYHLIRNRGLLSEVSRLCDFDYNRWGNEQLIELADMYQDLESFRYSREEAYQELLKRNLDSKFTKYEFIGGGYKSRLPGTLYVYWFSMFVGFGITNDFEARNRTHTRNFKKSKVDYGLMLKVSGCGKLIQELERHLKKTLQIWDGEIEGFVTECVHYADKELVIRKIKLFCQQHKELKYEDC